MSRIANEPPLPSASPALASEGTPVPHLNFWSKRWVQDVLPWATSVAIHGGLIILVLATYQAAGKIFSKVVQVQIIIPDATLANDPGGIPNPGLNDDSDKTAAQAADASVAESSGFASNKHGATDSLINTTAAGSADEASALIGQAAKGAAGSGGVSDSAAGALAQFGNPGGGEIGPHGKVFGHGGNAMRIVYICDASGSMMTKMDLLKLELQKSVQQLQPVQAFDVIFFQDSTSNPASHLDLAPDLVMATAGNKKKLYAFLQDLVGQSSTHVIPSLTAAFHLPNQPELIYLLTDGAFEDEGSAAVIDAINKLNADKKVKVNTVLFLGKEIGDAELKESREAMKRIASDNGGVYNEVSVSELGN